MSTYRWFRGRSDDDFVHSYACCLFPSLLTRCHSVSPLSYIAVEQHETAWPRSGLATDISGTGCHYTGGAVVRSKWQWLHAMDETDESSKPAWRIQPRRKQHARSLISLVYVQAQHMSARFRAA